MQILKPTLIYGHLSKELLPPPPLPFASRAFHVRQEDCRDSGAIGDCEAGGDCENSAECRGVQNLSAQSTSEDNRAPKKLVMFIGGFCDCIMRAVYREFEGFVCDRDTLKVYVSFPCRAFLAAWLPLLGGFRLFIIAHSWGARNAYWAIRDYEKMIERTLAAHLDSENFSESSARLDSEPISKPALRGEFKPSAIEYFLTLDPVGYRVPRAPLRCVELWENVYIEGKACVSEVFAHRPNFAAFVGHAWDRVKYAHINHAIYPPAHHASISPMLAKSSFYAKTGG